MIKSFASKATYTVFLDKFSKRLPPDIQQRGRIKLMVLHRAESLTDLLVPPGNKLEKLSGDLDGLYSIRINQQWRIVFDWQDGDAFEVIITDYH